MRISELVTWAKLVDEAASPSEVAAANLGQTTRRSPGREELAPADPRFSIIHLGWSDEPPRLHSIQVRLAGSEQIRDDLLEDRFGKHTVEKFALDRTESPPERATFFQGASGKRLCLVVSRRPDGTVDAVRFHAVEPGFDAPRGAA